MNHIYVLKKQIQKFILIGALGLILFSIFPVFNTTSVIPVAKAADADCSLFDPTSPKTYQSRVYVDKTDTTDTNNLAQGKADRTYALGQANKTGPKTQPLKGLVEGENLNIYVEVEIPADYKHCLPNWGSSFRFEYWTYPSSGPRLLSVNAQIDKFSGNLYANFTANKWFATEGSPLQTYVYFCKINGCPYSDQNGNDYIENIPVIVQANPAKEAQVIPPVSPLLTGGGGVTNPTATKTAEEIQLKFVKDGTTGLRDKYRVLYTETGSFTQMKFGSNGLGAVRLDWGNAESILTQTNKLKIPLKNSNIIPPSDPFFRYMVVGFNAASAKLESTGCTSGTFTEDCSNTIYNSPNTNGDASKEKSTLPENFDPVLNNAAWAKEEYITNKNPGEGQPMGSAEFRAIPIIWANGANDLVSVNWYSYVYGSKAVNFKLEIYKTEADIKKACENDAEVTDKSICSNPQKMRYEVGKIQEVSTSTDQQSHKSLAQSMYAFLVRIISQLIIWATGLIYEVFAKFIVPVLNALLLVRPYQDAFVNVIYPGWLILRNLSNIFFIIALLYVGLKILFQQSAAGTARSFIMRLIIMALLLNFSLVVAQGIVGIADTVQSQFLPATTNGQRSKVIEALGTKLMVEPIQSFRTAAIGNADGTFSTELSFADTTKPIVLFVLAVAAFFSFVAIGAFLAVRLVALLVLYMISPIAYVGFVMDDTKTYAKQWWSNFIKYAFLTPILVFFLNIAALVAVNTSSQTGSIIKIDGSYSGELVAGGLTIASHFIVLIFLYAGMMVAMKSGTIGANAIVSAAQKGFDALTTRPAKWAGSMAKGAAQNQYERRIKGGLFDPKAYSKAWKDSTERKNKKMMNDRLARNEGRLNPETLLTEKMRSLKYIARGGRFNKGNLLQSNIARLAEEDTILNDADRTNLDTQLTDVRDQLGLTQEEHELLDNGKLSFGEAAKIVSRLDARAKEHAKNERVALKAAEAAKNSGNTLEEADQRAIAAEQKKLKDEAETGSRDLAAQASRSKGLGEEGISLNNALKSKIAIEFDVDKAKEDLEKSIASMEENASKIQEQIETDDALRGKYGYGPNGLTMDKTRHEVIQADMKALTEQLSARNLPVSLEQMRARQDRQKDQEKIIEDMDGQELEEHFAIALNENNTDLAIAIAKKIAKEGDFDDLLDKHGFKNNVMDFQKFMDTKFKKMSPTVRMQVGSEISSIAQKNGNYAIARSTQVASDRSLSWGSSAHNAKKVNKIIENRSPEDLFKMKKNELMWQTATGRKLYSGAIDNFNSMNDNTTRLNKLKEKMPPKIANRIVDSENWMDLKENVRNAIKIAAGKNDSNNKPIV